MYAHHGYVASCYHDAATLRHPVPRGNSTNTIHREDAREEDDSATTEECWEAARHLPPLLAAAPLSMSDLPSGLPQAPAEESAASGPSTAEQMKNIKASLRRMYDKVYYGDLLPPVGSKHMSYARFVELLYKKRIKRIYLLGDGQVALLEVRYLDVLDANIPLLHIIMVVLHRSRRLAGRLTTTVKSALEKNLSAFMSVASWLVVLMVGMPCTRAVPAISHTHHTRITHTSHTYHTHITHTSHTGCPASPRSSSGSRKRFGTTWSCQPTHGTTAACCK